MDKIDLQDAKVNVKNILLQRDQERKAKIKTLKDEKETSSPDQARIFHELFEENCKKIADEIKLIEERKIAQNDLPEYFSKVSKDLQSLNRYLSVSTVVLTNYNVRRSLQCIEDFESKLKELEAELIPKKKFGFKARKTKPAGNDRKTVDEVDTTTNKVIEKNSIFTNNSYFLGSVGFGFTDRKDETLSLVEDEINKNDVELRNLQNCTVFILGNPATIHISNIKFCKILSGPVSTSVFAENCQECDLVIACQQLRVHSTKNTRFYVHVTSRAIIEDSSNVQFAPYNLNYEGINGHYISSSLDKTKNNWDQIDDFNWLAIDVPSPNWSTISENERVNNWPICLDR